MADPPYAPQPRHQHLACPRLTTLNRAVTNGTHPKPRPKNDPHLDLIRERGLAHEAAYLDQLKQEHGEHAVVEIAEKDGSDSKKLRSTEDRAADTLAAMQAGAQVIFQAAFIHEQWQGFADFLIRVDTPSALGDYSYEVVDTKLAKSVKAQYIHQLVQYSLHVHRIQGVMPEQAHVVLGDNTTVSFRVDDVLALHRRAVSRFERALADTDTTHEPDPVDHCSLCSFESECTSILRDRDDLHFVATLGRDARTKFMELDVATLATLSDLAPDAPHEDISDSTFTRVRVQAELQRKTRETSTLQHRHLPAERARGYAILPAPSPGDIFFDIEGDPFAGERGLVYLWGYELLDASGEPEYHALWAHDEPQEQLAFERFIDFVIARLDEYPDMHVYHYGSPEVAIPRRLAEQYGTRIAEVDKLLRAGTFCDLYAVVRQGIQVGQESYSIKKLEPFYDFTRSSHVRAGGGSIIAYETWIEAQEQEILDDLALYNHEDCTSTRELRDWLLTMRAEAAAEQGVDFDELRKPLDEDGLEDPEWVPEVQALQDALEAALPEDPADDDADEAERRLLASLLFYHRREQKPQWWRYFELLSMTADELEGEYDAIAGLEPDPAEEPIPVKRSVQHWLTFPAQEYRLSLGDVFDPATGMRAGTLVELEGDDHNGWYETPEVQRGPTLAEEPLPAAIIGGSPLDTKQQRLALMRVAEAYRDDVAEDLYPAIRALLRRALPTVDGVEPGTPLIDGAVTVEEAQRVTCGLEQTCLAVQGPPGAGKTYT
ncbi:MAG TPA: TM0106 family RecB-like putative nuclease, partial [Baekduia sp.]|nr:TM0106 family RecB-like putative nuclease [Baekduia sp.]